MITLEEFTKMVGGKHAVVLVCKVDGAPDMGKTFKKGDEALRATRRAYAMYKQGRVDGDPGLWDIVDAEMTQQEVKSLNQHFQKEKQLENETKKVSSKSKK